MKLTWLRSVPTTAYLIAGGVTLLLAAYTANNAHQRQLGREQVLTAQARSDAAKWRRTADSLAKAYHIDTVRATKWKTKWDSTGLRQLERVVDSLKALGVAKPESVPVLVPVGTLATADTAIKSCTKALATCDQLVGAERQRAIAAQREIAALKAQMPSKARKWLGMALSAGAGYAIGRIQP